MATVNSNTHISVLNISLSNAEVLSLHSSPVQLLAAPGAGFMHIVLSAVFVYKYGTTAFYDGPGPTYIYGSNVNDFWATVGTSFLNGTSDLISNATMQNGGSGIYEADLTEFENQPVNLQSSADPTVGDGTLTVILTYVTVKV